MINPIIAPKIGKIIAKGKIGIRATKEKEKANQQLNLSDIIL